MAIADPVTGQRYYTPYPNGPARGQAPGAPAGFGDPAAAAAAAPPPPAPVQDFGAYLQADPGYAALLASLRGQQGSLVTAFGDATGLTGIDGQPIGGDIATAAHNNPYSWLAQDRKATSQNVSGINNNANAHGVLFSGANAQGQVNEYAADQQRQYTARQALQTALGGLGSQQAQGLSSAYTNYLSGLPKPTIT